MCRSRLMKRLLSSTPGPLPLMARVLICRLVSKPGVTDEARQSWGGGDNSRLFHWVMNFVGNKTMHLVAVVSEQRWRSVKELEWGIVVESVQRGQMSLISSKS